MLAWPSYSWKIRRESGKEREREGGERTERKGGRQGQQPPPTHRIRNTPHLPHAKDVELAPSTLMHWSRAPVYGAMPLHGLRAHSVTLIDSIAWMFGGCDERGCWRDVFCFNTGEYLTGRLLVLWNLLLVTAYCSPMGFRTVLMLACLECVVGDSFSNEFIAPLGVSAS